MKLDTIFPSKYLKAADLQGHRVSVNIAKVELEDFDDGSKAIVYFSGKEKGLVLNKTNANMIAEITGSDDTNDWRGAAVVLYSTKVPYQGKLTDAIRVDFAEAAKPAAPVVDSGAVPF